MGVPGFDSAKLSTAAGRDSMSSLNRTKKINANNVIKADFGYRTAIAA